jgi:hypothetical protein
MALLLVSSIVVLGLALTAVNWIEQKELGHPGKPARPKNRRQAHGALDDGQKHPFTVPRKGESK